MKKILLAIFAVIAGLYLTAVAWDYHRIQKRIQVLPEEYRRVVEKYCPLSYSAKASRECCISSVESAALGRSRFVAPYTFEAAIPPVAKCMQQLVNVGGGCGEKFYWCEGAHGERGTIITMINYDIVADTPEVARDYRNIIELLAERFGEDPATTAFMLETEIGHERIAGRAFFKNFQYNGNFVAQHDKGSGWVIEMK